MNWSVPLLIAVVVATVALAAYWLTTRLALLAGPLIALQERHKDALTLISLRADKAEALAKVTLETLANFERAVGDKRAIENAGQFAINQNNYLQERVTELQRALLALHNPTVEARVVGQTQRGKDGPEPQVPAGPTRLQAASGQYAPTPWTSGFVAPYWGGKPALQDELVRTSTTLRPAASTRSDNREPGPAINNNDEAF